jgi:hypothetical protein
MSGGSDEKVHVAVYGLVLLAGVSVVVGPPAGGILHSQGESAKP